MGPKDGLREGSEGREERGGRGLGPVRGEVWLGTHSCGRSDALLCARTVLGTQRPQRGAAQPPPELSTGAKNGSQLTHSLIR